MRCPAPAEMLKAVSQIQPSHARNNLGEIERTVPSTMTILHISDPHAESTTMARLNDLAWLSWCKDDIVAVTGDCQSTSGRPGDDWNAWPQQWKFFVPGNHDGPDTFDTLSSWTRRDTPWWYNRDPLRFIGVGRDPNSEEGRTELNEQLRATRKRRGIRSVVLLSHYMPQLEEVVRGVRAMNGLRSILVLHGHNHPADSEMGKFGTEWEEKAIEGVSVFRSRVYSAASQRRGCAHRIEWNGGRYWCRQVVVMDQAPRIVTET